MSDRARPRIAIDDENGRPVAAADIEAVAPDVVRASCMRDRPLPRTRGATGRRGC